MQTKEFVGSGGKLTGIRAVRLEWGDLDGNGRSTMGEVPGSEFILPADLVLLAMGFVHPEPAISEELGLELDERQNIKAVYGIDSNAYKTSHDKVWVAGDARRGQSLVVWAIHEGREAARVIDTSLMGRSDLSSAHSFGYDQSPVS